MSEDLQIQGNQNWNLQNKGNKKNAIIMYFGMVIMKIAKYLLKLYSAIKVFIMPFTPS